MQRRRSYPMKNTGAAEERERERELEVSKIQGSLVHVLNGPDEMRACEGVRNRRESSVFHSMTGEVPKSPKCPPAPMVDAARSSF